MTDYIEILQDANRLDAVFALHYYGTDVQAYLTCTSSNIGEFLEHMIRGRQADVSLVPKILSALGKQSEARELDAFIECAHRACGDDETDSDLYDFIESARSFIKNNVITIRDH